MKSLVLVLLLTWLSACLAQQGQQNDNMRAGELLIDGLGYWDFGGNETEVTVWLSWIGDNATISQEKLKGLRDNLTNAFKDFDFVRNITAGDIIWIPLMEHPEMDLQFGAVFPFSFITDNDHLGLVLSNITDIARGHIATMQLSFSDKDRDMAWDHAWKLALKDAANKADMALRDINRCVDHVNEVRVDDYFFDRQMARARDLPFGEEDDSGENMRNITSIAVRTMLGVAHKECSGGEAPGMGRFLNLTSSFGAMVEPTPVPTASPMTSPSVTATPTPTPTASPMVSPSVTATATPTPTASPMTSPSGTPTRSPSP